MKKRILKFLQYPGAIVALVTYTLLILFGIVGRKHDQRVKEWFMRSIPYTSAAAWLVIVYYVVRWLW